MVGSNIGDEWQRGFVEFPKFSFDPTINDLVNHELTKSNRSSKGFNGKPTHVLDNYPAHLLNWVIRPHIPLSSPDYSGDVHTKAPDINSKRPIWKPPDPLSAEDLIARLVQEHGWQLSDFKALVDRLEEAHKINSNRRELTPSLNTDEIITKSDSTGMESSSRPNPNVSLGSGVGYSPIQDGYCKYHNQNYYQPEHNLHSIENIFSNGFHPQSHNEAVTPVSLVDEGSKANVSFLNVQHNYVTRNKTKYIKRNSRFIKEPSKNVDFSNYGQKETKSSKHSQKDQTLDHPASTIKYEPLFKQTEIKALNDFQKVHRGELEEIFTIENTYNPAQSKGFNSKASSESNLNPQDSEKDKTHSLTVNAQEQGIFKSTNNMKLGSGTYYTQPAEYLNVHEKRAITKGKIERIEFHNNSIYEKSGKPGRQLVPDRVPSRTNNFELNASQNPTLKLGKDLSQPHQSHSFISKSNFERMLEAIHSHSLSSCDIPVIPKDCKNSNISTTNTVGMLHKETERKTMYQDQGETESNHKSYIEERFIKRSKTAVPGEIYTSNEDSNYTQPDKPAKVDSKEVETLKSGVRMALYDSITQREECKSNVQSEELANPKCDEVRKNSQYILQPSLSATTASIFGFKPPPETIEQNFSAGAGDFYVEEGDNTAHIHDSIQRSKSSADQNRNERMLMEAPDTSSHDQYKAIELDGNTVINEILTHNLGETSGMNDLNSEGNNYNSHLNSLSLPKKVNASNLHVTEDYMNRDNPFVSNFDDLHSDSLTEETNVLFTHINDSMKRSELSTNQNINERMLMGAPDASSHDQYRAIELDGNTVINEILTHNLGESSRMNDVNSEGNSYNSHLNSLSLPKKVNASNLHVTEDYMNRDNPFVSNFDDLHSDSLTEETKVLFTHINDSMERSEVSPNQNINESMLMEATDTSNNEKYKAIELDENNDIKAILTHNLVETSGVNHIKTEVNSSNSHLDSLKTPKKINFKNVSEDYTNRDNPFISNFNDLHSDSLMEETEVVFNDKNTEDIVILDDESGPKKYNFVTKTQEEPDLALYPNKTDSSTLPNGLNGNEVIEIKSPNNEKDLIEPESSNYNIDNPNDRKATYFKSFTLCTELRREEELPIPIENENQEFNLPEKDTKEIYNNYDKFEKKVNVSHLAEWPLDSSQSQPNQQLVPENIWHSLKIRNLRGRYYQKRKIKNRGTKRTDNGSFPEASSRHPRYAYRPHGNIEDLWHNQITASRKEKRKWQVQDREMFYNDIRRQQSLKGTGPFPTPMSAERSHTGILDRQVAEIDQKSSLPNEQCKNSFNFEDSVSSKEDVNDIKGDKNSEQCCIM